MKVTTVVPLTRFVETAKEALVAPAGTVMVAGTEATDELLESVTTAPPGSKLQSTFAGSTLPGMIAERWRIGVELDGVGEMDDAIAGSTPMRESSSD